MGQYAGYVKAAGTALMGMGARSSAFDEAKLLNQRAGQSRALAQRAGNEDRREARYLLSAARARAAAGGGSIADESVVNVLAGIEAQGEMNALTRMFEGEVEARNDEASAVIAKNQGRAMRGASLVSAVTTAGETFASKYGDRESPAAPSSLRRSLVQQPGGFDPGAYYG